MLHLPPTWRTGPPAGWRWSKTNLTPARLAGGWEVEQCEGDQEHHSVYNYILRGGGSGQAIMV